MYKVGQVYTINFFNNEIDFTVIKVNSKGVTLKNDLTRVELKDYKESELSKMVIKQVK